MLVKATRLGYYGIKRRKEGAVFRIKSENEFSEKWMEKVETASPSQVYVPEPEIEVDEDELIEQDEDVI